MSLLNILLVDDDQSLVTTLSYGLRKAMGDGVSVAVCFSGSEALSMLASQAFNVVVSDFNMPGPSGLELLKSIRQNDREIILVLVTAYGTDVIEEGARQLGVGYMTKPFEPAFLVQLIEDLSQDARTTGSTADTSRVMEELGKPAGSSERIRLEGTLHDQL